MSLSRTVRVMIGDVMRAQRTPRLTSAACSLTRVSYLSTGSEHLKGTYCESREYRVGASPKFIYNFKFVAYTDIYRVWSGRYLLFAKSEPDLTVDLNNCVIAAPPRCSLSLAARVTVEPAGHSGDCL